MTDSAEAPEKEADVAVGKELDGRYVIDSILGKGGMGVVYEGRHTLIGKRVAIKVLRQELSQDGDVTSRFLQEARAASAVGSPHIVDVTDFGSLPDGRPYLVMEHIDGESLAGTLAREKRLPEARILRIGKQIARALAAAHTAGIVHRDLKPDNVMLVARSGDADFVKIVDFGIAKMEAATTQITRHGSLFGTPHYMSPEQAMGGAVDGRTDVYALGVILYELASGHVPFEADNPLAVLSQHLHRAPAAFSELPSPPKVTPSFEALVQRCLAKTPDERYPTMDALSGDLAALENGTAPTVLRGMRPRATTPAGEWHSAVVPRTDASGPRRSRWALALGAIVVVAVVGLLALRETPKAHPGKSAARREGTKATNAPSAALNADDVTRATEGEGTEKETPAPSTAAAPSEVPSALPVAAASPSVSARPLATKPVRPAPKGKGSKPAPARSTDGTPPAAGDLGYPWK